MIPVERVLREKRSLMLPLLIALALNVALLLLVVLPLMRSVSAEEGRALKVSAARADAERAFARTEAIVTGKSRAETDLARFYGQVLPRDQVGARRITYLNLQQLARAAGVTFSGQSTTVREPDEADGLTRFTTELTLSGSYRGIRQFIHAVETQPAFLVIESLTLERASGQDEPLEITVRLATYYRTSNGG
jgi:Tfp pilus assembly protein PilO